jgi:hypothetical protein
MPARKSVPLRFECLRAAALCASQLNTVEARAEVYPETLAFVRLVNKLLDLCESCNCGPAADAGAAAAYVFQFVREAVFENLDRCAPCCLLFSCTLAV